jgi:TonB family protein
MTHNLKLEKIQEDNYRKNQYFWPFCTISFLGHLFLSFIFFFTNPFLIGIGISSNPDWDFSNVILVNIIDILPDQAELLGNQDTGENLSSKTEEAKNSSTSEKTEEKPVNELPYMDEPPNFTTPEILNKPIILDGLELKNDQLPEDKSQIQEIKPDIPQKKEFQTNISKKKKNNSIEKNESKTSQKNTSDLNNNIKGNEKDNLNSPNTTGEGLKGRNDGGSGAEAGQKYAKANFSYIQKRIRRFLVYSPEAKRMGIQGTTKLAFTIKSDGWAESISIRSSSGNKDLDEAAVAAVKKASPFSPPPAPVTIVIPIVFKLK